MSISPSRRSPVPSTSAQEEAPGGKARAESDDEVRPSVVVVPASSVAVEEKDEVRVEVAGTPIEPSEVEKKAEVGGVTPPAATPGSEGAASLSKAGRLPYAYSLVG
jgi:hypothetical protein